MCRADKGKKHEAQSLLKKIGSLLKSKSEEYDAIELREESIVYENSINDMNSTNWNKQRKSMKSDSYRTSNQQQW